VLVLALDTTTRAGSVAVARDDEVLALVEGDGTRTHGERLPGELERALTAARVTARELDLLVVASGPGAFTGLRIGLATIQGLAMVLERPVIGISALDALAHTAWVELGSRGPCALGAWMDAQRGEAFAAWYRDGRALGEPVVNLPEALLASAPFDAGEAGHFAGDGAWRHREAIERRWGARARVLDQRPLAPALAYLGRAGAHQGKSGPPHALQPLYVRRPDAELDRERRSRS
jgi:tRNA threonylcarbamoyladenosine biosynthesis protein TsaB